MLKFNSRILCALGAVALLASSCAVTTKTTEGTTETLGNTTGASTELTSSTSPGGGDSAREMKIKAFASANLQRLQEDMARGGGEHLTSFAYLLGINTSHRDEFYALTKEKYPVLFSDPITSADMLTRLDAELDAYPQWRL